MYPYIHIFGKTIGSYAAASLIGFALCAAFIIRLCKKRGIAIEDVILLLVSVVTGIVVGGKALYGLTNWKYILSAFASFTDLKTLWSHLSAAFSGMVFYGGFLGSVAGVWIYTHICKTMDRAFALDLLAIATPLFHAFGRIGCFLGGCCYGIPCSWGITVQNNPVLPELNGVTRFPVQLIEAGCNLIIFAVLYLLFRRKERQFSLLSAYIFLYAPVRFILEFFRGDSIRGFLMGLSTSQWISIALALGALINVLFRRKQAVDRLS